MSNHQPAVSPPRGRRTSRLTSSVLTSALLITALAPLAAAPAPAATAATGPISTFHGYPEWYDDGTVKLALCYEAGRGCLSEPPNPELPVSYPDNFPDESFWFAAAADVGTIGSYEAALEAAHLNEAVIDGDQIGFGRLRFRFDGLQAGQVYTVTHPYGIHQFEATPVQGGGGEINVTIDNGCETTPCDWEAVGQAFLGDYAVGSTATFLRQTGTPPAGTIGDINTARTVTGAPSGNNSVSVVGPGINVSTNLFTVQGVIATVENGAPSTPNLVDASDTGPSRTDNITSVSTPTFDGTAAAGAAVELLVDGAVVATTTATGGLYSVTLTNALADGTHTVQARVADPADTVDGFATSGTLTITIDTVQKDMNGDGNPDIVARDSGGSLWLYPSTAAGGFGSRLQIGSGWGSMTAILQPGDWNGDGWSDVLARDTSGRLWLYTGTGNGSINNGRLIGTGWGGMTALVTPGDFNGDNRVDLLARSSTGALFLYPGNGTGGFGTRTQPGSGWGGFTALLSTGDFSGDGRSDVIARTSSGALWLYRGSGTGTFGTANQIGSGWNGFTITGPGAWGTADAHSDLVARDSAGGLFVYRGSGTGGFVGSRTQIGNGWGGFTIVQ